MGGRSKQDFPKSPALVGVAVVGAYFIAVGLHAQSTGLWHDRPARPYLQMGLGSLLVAWAGYELIGRWWRDRAGGGRR